MKEETQVVAFPKFLGPAKKAAEVLLADEGIQQQAIEGYTTLFVVREKDADKTKCIQKFTHNGEKFKILRILKEAG